MTYSTICGLFSYGNNVKIITLRFILLAMECRSYFRLLLISKCSTSHNSFKKSNTRSCFVLFFSAGWWGGKSVAEGSHGTIRGSESAHTMRETWVESWLRHLCTVRVAVQRKYSNVAKVHFYSSVRVINVLFFSSFANSVFSAHDQSYIFGSGFTLIIKVNSLLLNSLQYIVIFSL